jgi:hypothetical protein
MMSVSGMAHGVSLVGGAAAASGEVAKQVYCHHCGKDCG